MDSRVPSDSIGVKTIFEVFISTNTEYHKIRAIVSHRFQGEDSSYPWERIERSNFRTLHGSTPDRILPSIVDIRDISVTLYWDKVENALEYLLGMNKKYVY